jgi:hypothetical protein
MSGLSYFDEGGQAETTETAQTKTAVPMKAPASRSPYSIGTPTSTMLMDDGVLSAMERLYYDRLEQQGGFMEGMKDAAAWWSGGIEGPSAGVSRRTQEREKQTENLFQLQAEIARFKAAQEAQKAFQQRKINELGLPGAASRPGAPGAPNISEMPPEIRQALENARTEADYNKLYSEWAKKKAEIETSPEFDKPQHPVVFWSDEAGEWTRGVVSSRTLRANPGKYFNDDGTPAYGAAPAKAAPAPAAPAPAAPAPAEPAEAPVVSPVAGELTPEDMAIPRAAPAGEAPVAPANAPVNYTFDELTPDQFANLQARMGKAGYIRDATQHETAAASFNKQPLEKRKAIFESLSSEPPVQVAAAPSAPAPSVGTMRPPQAATPVAPAPARRPPQPTAGQLERKTEVEKAKDIEISKGSGQALVARENETIKQGQKADTNIREFTKMIDLLKETPNMTGIAQVPGVSSSVIALTKDGGVTFPIVGTLRAPELEEAVARKKMSPRELENRSMFDTLAKRAALAYRKEVYEGTGQVSDSETKIAEMANGLSTTSPFRANLMFAILHKERQQLNKDRYDGWIKFKQANPNKNFSDYEQTDFYRVQSIESMDKRIQAAFPGFFKDPKDMKPLSSFSKKGTR